MEKWKKRNKIMLNTYRKWMDGWKILGKPSIRLSVYVCFCFSKIVVDVFPPWHCVNTPECSRPAN